MSEEKIKQMQKEIDRLSRRNKILTKRLKRLQEENGNLATEIDTLEELHSPKFKRKIKKFSEEECPKCGEELGITELPNQTLIMCKGIKCNYRKIIKK